MAVSPVLAFDLGGTKLAAALVDGCRLIERRECPTDRGAGAEAWIDAAIRLAEGWRGYRAAGIAATGLVRAGAWRALNRETLSIPDDFPLAERLSTRLGVPVAARNDAQAAAWGEYRFGTGRGSDLAFVTVSTGIGGGLVMGGRLVEGRSGLAGHLGIAPVAEADGTLIQLEDLASGRALDRIAGDRGGAPAVAAAALAGAPWAGKMLDRAIAPLALALRRLQLECDPACVVVGGGLGLAPGYLDRLRRHLASVPVPMRPDLRAAALGADAGLIGIADLAAAGAGTAP
jgi:predicted NBD/HSP70 family sugar kinase